MCINVDVTDVYLSFSMTEKERGSNEEKDRTIERDKCRERGGDRGTESERQISKQNEKK